ncbi:hypothetical protein BO71DRAFT_282062, partial [Aspergillus ellipticus CBS 707.79]
LQILQTLLDAKADINAQGGSHGTVLIAAVESGHLDLVKLLVEKGADPNIKGPMGTPLDVAHSKGH